MNWIDQCLNDPTGKEVYISQEEAVYTSPDESLAIPYRVWDIEGNVAIPTRKHIKEQIRRLRAIANGLEYFCDLASDEEIEEINARTRQDVPTREIELGQNCPSLSHLYILQAGALPIYKIGKGNPDQRLKSIQKRHCKHKLSVVYSGLVDDPLTREGALHRFYRHDQIPPAQALEMGLGIEGFTEWFKLSEQQLREAIHGIKMWVEEAQLSFYGEGVGQ